MVVFTLFPCSLASKISKCYSCNRRSSEQPTLTRHMGRALLWEQRSPGSDPGWQPAMALDECSHGSYWLTAEKGSPSPPSVVNPASVACSETGCPNRYLKWEGQKSTSLVGHMGLWHEIGPETFNASGRILGFWGTWMWKGLPGLRSSGTSLWVWTSTPNGTGKNLCPLLDLILRLMLQERLTTTSKNSLTCLALFSIVSTLIKCQISWVTPSAFTQSSQHGGTLAIASHICHVQERSAVGVGGGNPPSMGSWCKARCSALVLLFQRASELLHWE